MSFSAGNATEKPLPDAWLAAIEKKVLQASERKEEERKQWREQTEELDASKFVFLDESGSNIALTRLYARARDAENEHEGLFHAIVERR
jgi:hypothetical protein